MNNFHVHFKKFFFSIFFIFIYLYAFNFSFFVKFNSFIDEEIVIFTAIFLVCYFFLKLNLNEINVGVSGRITTIENEFKKNYKIAIENLNTLEGVFQRSNSLTTGLQKNFNLYFYELIYNKFAELEDKYYRDLFLIPKINFLKQDLLTLLNLKKNYKLSILNKSFNFWSRKNLNKSSFLLKI